MKSFINFSIIGIYAIFLSSCLLSCSSDDVIDSLGKGTATAVIDSETRKTAKVKWVQLWKDGPKFAVYNMGVIDGKPESSGERYDWYSLFDENDLISNFPWGENWRMPSKEEFELLLKYCSIEWTVINDVEGIIVTGIGDYSENSIFLPACNYTYVDYEKKYLQGDYWSSTPESRSNAYWFCFYEKDRWPKEVKFNGKHRYKSVRPVLVE